MPASIAASALACPVPRVSWKWTPSGSPGASARTASSSSTVRRGVTVPMVSPRQSWSAPWRTACRTTSRVRAGSVRPSKGQSHAVAMITSRPPPAPCASSAISPIAAAASALGRPAFATLCESAAETTYSRCAMPASIARTAPRVLATSADQWTSGHCAEVLGHLVGVGQRRHRLGRDEAGDLDAPDAGVDERRQHRDLVVEQDRVLELQAVAHADLADVDAIGQRERAHAAEYPSPTRPAPTARCRRSHTSGRSLISSV